MKTEDDHMYSKENSFLISNFNRVTDVGNGFLELTGYSKEEFINKDTSQVFITLLRLPSDIFETMNLKDSMDCYIFTKCLEAREVNISLIRDQTEEIFYSVIEKSNSRLEDKLTFEVRSFKDNMDVAAIYSAPELILLKANQKYLEFIDPPYNSLERCIGKFHREIINEFEGNQTENYWNSLLKTQKANYLKEFKYEKKIKVSLIGMSLKFQYLKKKN